MHSNFLRRSPTTAGAHQALNKVYDAQAPLPAWVKNLTRIVVAVDPTVVTGKDTDECGIIVAGMGRNGRGYVLDDLSARMSPAQWGAVAVGACHRYGTRRLVIEINMGGALVTDVIRSIDHTLNMEPIRAVKGKALRAEPVAALYEQGKVIHLEHLRNGPLEKQMVEWTAETKKSPDRLDALVYAISDLFFTPVVRAYRFIPDEIETA